MDHDETTVADSEPIVLIAEQHAVETREEETVRHGDDDTREAPAEPSDAPRASAAVPVDLYPESQPREAATQPQGRSQRAGSRTGGTGHTKPTSPQPPLSTPPQQPVTTRSTADAPKETTALVPRSTPPVTPPHKSTTPPLLVHDYSMCDTSALQEETIARKGDHIVDTLGKVFLWVSIPIAAVCCIIAIVLYSLKDIEAVTVSHSIAGLCAFTSLVLTAIQVFMHLSVYTNPTQQRYIIRIILMCPIYAIDSFVGLVAFRYATVVNLVRDSYESYVIYTFFNLLMSYLGGEEKVVEAWSKTMPEMEHLPPMCCLPHVKLNQKTLTIWKICLLQYMIINPLLTLIAIPLYFTGYYEDGKLAPNSVYAWMAAIEFLSVTFAFTSLVYFFFGSKHLLMEHNPLPKFGAIKTVVFLSFWQTVLLAALNHFKVIPHSDTWTADEVSTGMGNFCLCVEMFLITIAHRWIFTDEPYHPLSGRSKLTWFAVRHAFAVTDVITDTHSVVQLMTPLNRKGGNSRYEDETMTPTV
jgi:hypothetical protein